MAKTTAPTVTLKQISAEIAEKQELSKKQVTEIMDDLIENIVKNLKKMAEDAKVAIRGARRDANELLKKKTKDKVVSEDEGKRLETEIQKHTDLFIKAIDDRLAKKEQEVLKL